MNKKISSIFAIIVILLIGGFLTFLFAQDARQQDDNYFGGSTDNGNGKKCKVDSDCGEIQKCGMSWECSKGNCYQISKECPIVKPIGGDKDEHGCLTAGGYLWCEEKQKCLREWEESCSDNKVPIKSDYFCGASTYEACESETDCITGGCSSQICASKNGKIGGMATTCEFKDCYDSQKYGFGCTCIDKKCQWTPIKN